MSILKWIGMGKTTTNEPWNSGSEKYFGLENFGNTCYCNSILQALYFCKPFRECVVNFPNGQNGLLAPPMSPINSQTSTSSLTNGITSKKDVNGTGENKANGDVSSSNGFNEDTLFSALKDLFWKISSQKKRTGVMAPNGFIAKLKKENEIFRSTMHQDAHEFLNYTLNAIAENVMEQQKKMEELERQKEQEQLCSISEKSKSSVNGSESEDSGVSGDGSSFKGSEITSSSKTTWVHQLFEGTLTNETKCLTCETITSRDDPFLDLSIDIQQNSSVTSCLRQFSASEMLVHQDKFFCDVCCGLQEAEKRMKIKKLPNVLALHLKRFKYQEKLQKYIKLSYRVAFPFELRLFNTCDTTKDPDRLYELYAICVHIGSGPHHGHYVTLIKSMGQWLLFDDDTVEPVDESEIHKYFGDVPATGSGYVLFYQACDLDLNSLGLPYSVWANNVASSASSADFEVSAEGAAESHISDAPPSTSATTNNASDNVNNNTTTTPINNEEPKRERAPPVREPSFPERWILRKKDNNSSDKRKSNVDHDSKDNDDSNTSEKPLSHEKSLEIKTSWFGSKSNNKSNKEKDKDKKDDKDEKKSSSNLESLFEESNTQTNKKDKKAEKEERKKEKKARLESKKMEKLAAAVSVSGIKSGTI